ncbi:MAG: hypothetical protein JOS17DRAFT_748895 [Linnemannia elongata]|nr:MAG: hypothetical protein JOS17DRAFT_748895 [Linnemannia elongata]
MQQQQQQQQMQQGLNYFSPSLQQRQQRQQEQGCGNQGRAGGQGITPSPSTQQHQQQPHPPTTQPPPTRPASKIATNSLPLLSVLESCPSLVIADCRVPVPLQSVIASFPNWSCHSRLQVLRLELEELSGAGAMDADEEAVMEMFVKSLFIGSRVDLEDVELEDAAVETSDVGESSSWSSGPAGGPGEISSGGSPFLPRSRSPTSSGSTTPGTMVSSSSGGSTAALPVHHILGAPSLLDETGLASGSQSPSSSLSSWTTGSTSSGHRTPSTTFTESPPTGGSAQDVGQSQRRKEKQQRVLGQAFAMTVSPLSLSSASDASTASTVSSSSVCAKAGGSYFPHPTLTTSTRSSSSSYSTTTSSSSSASTSSVSKSTPSSSQSQKQSSQDERKSREAVSTFLSSCSNYQVDAVGKLMALQFLVEHQLATMPRLECFWLGSKMFRIPSRRSASSSSS